MGAFTFVVKTGNPLPQLINMLQQYVIRICGIQNTRQGIA